MRLRAVLALFLCCAISLAANSALARQINAKAAILYDMNTSRVLYEQDAAKQIAPASLTKIMTLYLAYEAMMRHTIRLNDVVKVSKAAARAGGSSMHLTAGEKVKVSELLKGIAVSSGNDAAIALAEHIAGSQAAFVKMMNAKARALGMTSTTFKNPNGLPAKGQITCARDMLRLSIRYIKDFPQALKVNSLKSYTHNGYTRKNSNKLLSSCLGVDGIKTGYVDASGFNLVATAERDNRRIIAIVLGAKSSSIRATEAKFLTEAGFKAGPNTRYVASKGDTFKEVQAERPPRPSEKLIASAAPKQQAPANNTASSAPPKPGPKNLTASNTMAAPKTEAAPRTVAATSPAGAYALQESSWAEPDKAEKRAEHLRLEGLEVRVVSADLGPKGVWHRVLIGSFSSKSEARSYKESLKQQNHINGAIIVNAQT